MLSVTELPDGGYNGRSVAIDLTSQSGPFVALTPGEWRQLVKWIKANGDRL